MVDDGKEALWGEDVLKRQLSQMTLNTRWLIERMDLIHAALCPGHIGTWQERAEEAVRVAEMLAQRRGSDIGVTHKDYLGDGVYAAYDGYQIVLTAEDGIMATDTIYIDPHVETALKCYIDRINEVRRKGE